MPQRLHLQSIISNWTSAKLSLCSCYTEAARLSSRLWDFELDTAAATATIATTASFATWQGDVCQAKEGKAKEESSSLIGRTIITDTHWRKRSRRATQHIKAPLQSGGWHGRKGDDQTAQHHRHLQREADLLHVLPFRLSRSSPLLSTFLVDVCPGFDFFFFWHCTI